MTRTAYRLADAQDAPSPVRETAELLGGRRILHREIVSEAAAHELVMRGIPAGAMGALMGALGGLAASDALGAIGVSERSFARRKAAPKARLPVDESGRLWQFAGIVAQAKRAFGSLEEAVLWLGRPAIALENKRPIELLRTLPGAQLVEQLLTRIEYGVYT
jgi:putative toxin-antitoxin system antitoxin component (TIGR02293 family)